MTNFDTDWGIEKIEQGPFSLPDQYWIEIYSVADRLKSAQGLILCPHSFKKHGFVDYDSYNGSEKLEYIILQRDLINRLPTHLIKTHKSFPVFFENAVFLLLRVPSDWDGILAQADAQHQRNVIHLHIPKTAGHSFLAGVQHQFQGVKYIACRQDYYNYSSVKGYNFFSGHFHYSDLASLLIGNNSVYGIIRDPLERFISAYVHANRLEKGYKKLPGVILSMQELNIHDFTKTPYFDFELHRQTYYLSKYSKVKKSIEEHFESILELVESAALTLSSVEKIAHLSSIMNKKHNLSTFASTKKLNTNPPMDKTIMKKGDLEFIRDHLNEYFIEEREFYSSLIDIID